MHRIDDLHTVHYGAILQSAYPYRKAARLVEGGNALCALRTVRGLHNSCEAERGAGGKRLADEQVHVALQEAAGAELQNWRHLHLDNCLDHAAGRIHPLRQGIDKLVQRGTMGIHRPRRNQARLHRRQHFAEVVHRDAFRTNCAGTARYSAMPPSR